MAEIIKAVKGFNQDMTCTPTEDIKSSMKKEKHMRKKLLMYVIKVSMLVNFQ